jgi:hypothetical protein
VIKLSERQQFLLDSLLLCYYHTRWSSFPCVLYNTINHTFSITASNVCNDGTAGNGHVAILLNLNSYKNKTGIGIDLLR